MKTGNHKLSLMQFILMIHGVQLGVGVLALPRDLAAKTGTDGWIAIIITWFFSTIASLLIIKIMEKYPNGTILDLISRYFGKWIGKIASLLFALYFALLAHVIFTREAMFIQAWILPNTKVYVLILLLVIPSYQIVKNNITILGRYSVFVFFMTLWTILIYLIPLKDAEWLHLLPVIKEGWAPILTAVKTTIFTFMGFELAFFLYPFLEKKEKAAVGVVIANTLSMFAYLIVTIVAFVFFSPDEITIFHEPTIEILKVVEFQFIERLEIVLFSFYLFTMSTTILPLMFLTVFCTSQLLGEQNHAKHLIWYLIIGVLYDVFFPPTFDKNVSLQKLSEQIGVIIAFIFPVCLGGYVWIHGFFKGRAAK